MTTTVTKKPCETSTDCIHATCRICGVPVRPSLQRLDDHKGTLRGFPTVRLCNKHRNQGGSNIITDAELAWMRTEYPHAYHFHADRRARGIPADGLKLKGDK